MYERYRQTTEKKGRRKRRKNIFSVRFFHKNVARTAELQVWWIAKNVPGRQRPPRSTSRNTISAHEQTHGWVSQRSITFFPYLSSELVSYRILMKAQRSTFHIYVRKLLLSCLGLSLIDYCCLSVQRFSGQIPSFLKFALSLRIIWLYRQARD